MTANDPNNPYDQTPYPSYAVTASHPRHLAAIAGLFGHPSVPPAACRVLEIGCASGGNLLPMAAALPQSHFVGIDFSQVQIDAAKKAQAALGLTNIEFICVDIRAADAAALGQFDYVMAHGIYSWLPPDAQAAMLTLSRACLSPSGIAYISYNTLPGWRMRGIIRDMMLYHAEQHAEPQVQVTQAKALLDFMATHVPAEGNPYGQYLRSELQMVTAVDENYLAHDHLEVHNEALYFRDFMARANAADLDYLGEADFSTMTGSGLAAPALEKLKAEITDIVRLEQYFDFMRNRTFRMTLLIWRGSALRRHISAAALMPLYVSASLKTDAAPDLNSAAPVLTTFVSGTGTNLQTNTLVTKAAFLVLAEQYPQCLAFPALLAAARARLPAQHCAAVTEAADSEALGNDLLVAYSVPGLVQLHGADPGAVRYTGAAGERLRAPAYARWQDAASVLVNLYHVPVQMNQTGRLVLALLDGTRDRAALLTAFEQLVQDGKIVLEQEGKPVAPADRGALIGPALDAVLRELGAQAFLCRSDAG